MKTKPSKLEQAMERDRPARQKQVKQKPAAGPKTDKDREDGPPFAAGGKPKRAKPKPDGVSKGSPAHKVRRAANSEQRSKKRKAAKAAAIVPEALPPKPPHLPLPKPVRLKAEQKVRLGNGRIIEIGGMSDERKEDFVWFRMGRRFVITLLSDWHGGSRDGFAMLRQRGFTIVRGFGDITDAVDKLKRFPRAPIVTRPGWCSLGFTMADGRVLVPEGHPAPFKAFTSATGMLNQAGSLDIWLASVAEPLADHLLAVFFMMMMFVPALIVLIKRSDNIGLELSGEAGRGKSTLQYIIASAAGPAFGAHDETYWRSLNTTINALETVLEMYNDMPLVLDEAGLVQGAGKEEARMSAMRDMAFKLYGGRTKHRMGEPTGPRHRVAYMLSTNRPIASLMTSAHAAESEAIADRLITIPLLTDRAFGIFDRCPPSYASTGAFADALKQAASENYGHALPHYLQYLVEERARDAEALIARITADVNRFLKRSGINVNDGSQQRVAEAMGLIYAAGRLAQQAGALPRSYRCGPAALSAFILHRAHGRPTVSFDDRLGALARHPNTVDVSKPEAAPLNDKERSRCQVFLYTGRSGNRELVIPTRHINRVFPGWRGMSNDADVGRRLKTASDRDVLERPIGDGGAMMSCYVFDITDLVD